MALTIKEIQEKAHQTALEKGWHRSKKPRSTDRIGAQLRITITDNVAILVPVREHTPHGYRGQVAP